MLRNGRGLCNWPGRRFRRVPAPLRAIIAPPPRVDHGPAVALHRHGGLCHAVDEVAVVADQQHGTVVIAEDVLQLRTKVEAAATKAGLYAPTTLRTTFENDDGFDDSTAEASAELATIDRYVDAVAKRPARTTPLSTLGLWNETPEADLIAARDAFARGDLQASTLASDEAAASWSNAESIGQGRAVSIAALALFALMTLGLFATMFRRRRRRRLRMAHRIAPR